MTPSPGSRGGRPDATPAVSVVMPAHNAGRFIGSAVRSILEQSWTSLELIVVDDGSTDDTAGRVAGFEDERLRLLRLDELRSTASALGIPTAGKTRSALVAAIIRMRIA